MAPSDKLSVIITCKGRLAHLRTTLPHWLRQDARDVEIVVVDYGCPDGTAAWLAEHYPSARVVAVTRDVDEWNGSRARNIGARAALGQWFAFADACLLPGDDYLSRMLRPALDGAGLVKLIHGFDRGRPLTNGACLVARRLFYQVHGFDEGSTLWGFLDADFYARCAATGARIAEVHNVSWLPSSEADRFRYRRQHRETRASYAAAQEYVAARRGLNPYDWGKL